jgi:hypothetical protein
LFRQRVYLQSERVHWRFWPARCRFQLRQHRFDPAGIDTTYLHHSSCPAPVVGLRLPFSHRQVITLPAKPALDKRGIPFSVHAINLTKPADTAQ